MEAEGQLKLFGYVATFILRSVPKWLHTLYMCTRYTGLPFRALAKRLAQDSAFERLSSFIKRWWWWPALPCWWWLEEITLLSLSIFPLVCISIARSYNGHHHLVDSSLSLTVCARVLLPSLALFSQSRLHSSDVLCPSLYHLRMPQSSFKDVHADLRFCEVVKECFGLAICNACTSHFHKLFFLMYLQTRPVQRNNYLVNSVIPLFFVFSSNLMSRYVPFDTPLFPTPLSYSSQKEFLYILWMQIYKNAFSEIRPVIKTKVLNIFISLL